MSNNTPLITIAIDGYSSSGKSSMAKALAKKIGYRYIDSGAMYRAVTLYAMRNNMVTPDHVVDCDALVEALPQIKINFKVCEDGQHTMLNDEDVEKEIRQLDVSNNVSQVAVIPAIRHASCSEMVMLELSSIIASSAFRKGLSSRVSSIWSRVTTLARTSS